MGFRERLDIRYITSGSLEGSDNVLRQCHGVKFKVGLKQKVDDIIDAPFA
jgi:hypothetical protein